MRFSSPVIFPNSCLGCTDVSIMTHGDIFSVVHVTAACINLEGLGEAVDRVLAFRYIARGRPEKLR